MNGRIIPVILEEGMGISRNWATLPTFLAFYVYPQKGAGGYVIYQATALQWVYNEVQGLLEVNFSTILDPVGPEPLYTLIVIQ